MNNKTLRKRIKEGDFKDIENWDVSNVTDMSCVLPVGTPKPRVNGVDWFYLYSLLYQASQLL
jgi:hypothetical protein